MRSLTLKLTLAFLLVGVGGIVVIAAMIWGGTTREFNRFLQDRGLSDYVREATEYYQENGSWVGVEEYLRQQGLIYSPGQVPTGNNPPPAPFALIDTNGQLVVPFGPYSVGEKLSEDASQQKTPVNVNNQVVGYVVQTGRPPRANTFETSFLSRMNKTLIFAALAAAVLAVLLGLLLARTVTRPVRELTIATRAMSKGQLSQEVQVRSKDELGELTQSFNKMSAELERSNHLRKQMTADIAHDLRSPLAVITGYLEGLKDGVLKPSPSRFSAMYDEAVYLQNLVEDLRILSLADAGELSINKQDIQPGELIEKLAEMYRQTAEKKQVTLRAEFDANLPCIKVDPKRLSQVFGNLINNALCFTEANGEIVLSAHQEMDAVFMEVKDSGAGIDSDVLPHVFDRFYRGDDSRQDGGSGLGLAIARSIVELHGGEISAASDGLGKGSRFTIRIPFRN